MGEQFIAGQPVKVFISYSWDNDSHREWVREFATRLRTDGINVTLDRWDAVPGDQLPEFMERAVHESDFVLCICTPLYKTKSDQRNGGVGYEGDVITGEVFVTGYQRKFIPVLRAGEWKTSAPTWLIGKYYIDLIGDPYSEKNYRDLLTTLRSEREKAPPIGGQRTIVLADNPNDEFVNRDIELATLDPVKLEKSYWQCALVSAPTGYGKSRLLNRLIGNIQLDLELKNKWGCCYINLQDCAEPDNVVAHMVKEITGEVILSDVDEDRAKNMICNQILEKMPVPENGDGSRNILFVVDSIELLPSSRVEWLSSIIHKIVVDSYIDYEKKKPSFIVRVILAGVDAETFWNEYLKWETSIQKYRLKPPKRLPLSAFDDLAVQDMIDRRAGKAGIPLDPSDITDVSYELQYLSGGHPQVVSEILNELVTKKFRRYKDYLRDNREQLVRNHVSAVAKKVLRRFPLPQAQQDIKTICVFRLIDLNTLQKLLGEKLVSLQVDINLLGMLCENKILNLPNSEKLFYHDDIIRRILYLDIVYGNNMDSGHVQKIHKCGKTLYQDLIKLNNEQKIIHFFFMEWLFHALQIADFAEGALVQEWKNMLSNVPSTSLPMEDLKRAIREKLEKDDEVKYLYRERFSSDDFSPLFAF